MPDPDLGSSVQPNPDLPANLPAVRPLSSIIPASWTGGFLPGMQPRQPDASLGSPQNPINLPSMQTIDPNAPRSPMDIMRDRLGASFGQPGGGAAQPPALVPPPPPSYQQQPAWQNPYTPVGPRPVGQIGDDWWPVAGAMNYPGSYGGLGIPSGMQALGVMGRAGGILSKWGPPSASPFYGRASGLAMQLAPILDMISKGQFSKNQLAMRQGQLRLMNDEMLFNMQQGLMQHQQELLKYQEVFNAFNNNAYSQDETENARIAHQKIEELAQSNPNILGVLKNGGIDAVQNYVVEEDRHFRDAYAGFASAKKSRDETSGESVFADTPGATTKTDPLAPAKPSPSSPTTASGVVPSDARKEIAATHGNLGDNGMDKAEKLFRGEIGAGDLKHLQPDPRNPRVSGATAVTGAAADMQHRFDQIADGPGTFEDKLEKVKEFSPETADDIAQLADYHKDPRDFSTRGGYRGHMTSLASRLTGGQYNESMYQTAQKYKTGPDHMTLQNAASLYKSSVNIYKALRPFKNNETIPGHILEQLVANTYSGNDKYSNLYAAINDYANIASRTLAGKSAVTLVHDMLRNMSTTRGAIQIRGQVQQDNGSAYARIQGIQQQWEGEGGRGPVPGFIKGADIGLKAFNQSNTVTGEFPKEDWVPEELKALSRNPTTDPPPGYAKGRAASPLTDDQISKGKEFIQRYGHDPAQQENVQKIREWLLDHGAL